MRGGGKSLEKEKTEKVGMRIKNDCSDKKSEEKEKIVKRGEDGIDIEGKWRGNEKARKKEKQGKEKVA